MLVDKQYIVLEARVQVRLETQLDYDRVVMAVNVGVDAVQALEHVSDEGGKGLGERHADPAWEHLLVVDVGLHPRHEVFDVLGRRHLGGLLVVFTILPEILEPELLVQLTCSQSSVFLTRQSLSFRGSSAASRTR
jgi:hypothetical protein